MKIKTLYVGPTGYAAIIDLLAGRQDLDLRLAENGAQGLAEARAGGLDLVIAAEGLADMSGIAFAEALTKVNAMINCAVVSSLSAEDFHEASEGLGILARLKPEGDPAQIAALIAQVAEISGLLRAGG